MSHLRTFVKLLLPFFLFFLASCSASEPQQGPVGPAGPAGPEGPPGPPGESASASQEYVGSEQCGACHKDEYARFLLSGHPYQLTKIQDGAPPSFPHDDITGGVHEPPEGYTWDNISYIVGGFAWKARFLDENGYMITGDEDSPTQYNFANEELETESEWVAFHAGEELAYDCGSCHTTGYVSDGHQDGLEGIIGSWAFPGVQCEECHGPGSLHAADPQGINMVVDRTSQQCQSCHTRDNPALIDAVDGFIDNHEQYDELFSSKHFALSCINCHDPHASAVYVDEELNPDIGIRQECETCHWQQVFQNNRRHLGVDCVSCHMPPMVKSAVGDGDIYTADLSSHLFAINTNPEALQFDEDGTLSKPYITLQYACLHCHNGQLAGEKDMETLAEMADGYHTPPEPTPEPTATPEVTATPEMTPVASPTPTS